MSKRRLTAFRLELPYFWRGVFRLAKWLSVAALILFALNVVGYWCLQLEVYGPDMTAATRWPDNYAGRALKLTGVVSRKPRNFRQPINMACLALGR